jgi:hypothetical protein
MFPFQRYTILAENFLVGNEFWDFFWSGMFLSGIILVAIFFAWDF